ncbi:UBC-like protein [Epithele typhae]|uniref:UBC-like protein n=1 Tax=Epithele typhae TaxID=378194 RepID=UPI002008E824|nr:UBC-like protein [Epithele typhae]KAH9946295.1 UBC-like protein [Epithele typhae]
MSVDSGTATAIAQTDDIFEWHCTIRGTPGTEFEGGLYHLRILLPTEYPFRPPSIMMLTPNGRFELNTKICISFTNYHEELWQPAWGVRTAIVGLQGFFPLRGTAAVGVGAIEYPTTERKRLAALSRDWVCPHCKVSNHELLPDPPTNEADKPPQIPAQLKSRTHQLPRRSTSSSTVHPRHRPQANPSDFAALDRIPILRHAPAYARPAAPTAAIPPPQQPSTRDGTPQPALVAAVRQTPRRPPILLDTAICVLLVLMFALIARRFL